MPIKMKLRRFTLINAINNVIGRFNLTDFESFLLSNFERGLPDDFKKIFLDQRSRFNRVDRALVDDERIDHGDTTFYWIRHGKSQINEYPMRFPFMQDEKVLAKCIVNFGEKYIEVRFICVKGVMCIIQYWSDDHIYYPNNPYQIVKMDYFLEAN